MTECCLICARSEPHGAPICEYNRKPAPLKILSCIRGLRQEWEGNCPRHTWLETQFQGSIFSPLKRRPYWCNHSACAKSGPRGILLRAPTSGTFVSSAKYCEPGVFSNSGNSAWSKDVSLLIFGMVTQTLLPRTLHGPSIAKKCVQKFGKGNLLTLPLLAN